MGRPVQDVRVFGVQDRRGAARTKKPWLVRRRVDGVDRSTSFPTKAQADRYRRQLLDAVEAGDTFDPQTGEPTSWAPQAGDAPFYVWVREWLAGEWPEWQPKTRRSHVEALSKFVPVVRTAAAPTPPATLRMYLVRALRPDFDPADNDPECERWLERWSPGLAELDRDLLAKAERELVTRLDGTGPLGRATAARYRKTCRSCVRRASDLQRIPADPWPPEPRGRARRKVVRAKRSVDTRRLPSPMTVRALLAEMPSHQPGSRMYQLMSAVTYYGGLRPGEVVMLRPKALSLPESGWGRIDVVEADVDYDEPGDPKEGERSVPIPPVLVAMLRAWITEHCIGAGDLLFRTRNGRRPHPSNWGRCLKRAAGTVGAQSLSPYTLRHSAATTWLQAGVPLGEVSRRLGNSVETLVSTYVGALEGDEQTANDRIDAVLSPPEPEAQDAQSEAGDMAA